MISCFAENFRSPTFFGIFAPIFGAISMPIRHFKTNRKSSYPSYEHPIATTSQQSSNHYPFMELASNMTGHNEAKPLYSFMDFNPVSSRCDDRGRETMFDNPPFDYEAWRRSGVRFELPDYDEEEDRASVINDARGCGRRILIFRRPPNGKHVDHYSSWTTPKRTCSILVRTANGSAFGCKSSVWYYHGQKWR